MVRTARWQVEWVDDMPPTPGRGVLYISVKHRLTIHLCACGCGEKTVLPLGPADWQMEYDGKTVSVAPSIGNLQAPCRSHYFIVRSRTVWAAAMTAKEIAAARHVNAKAKAREVRRTLNRRVWWRRMLGKLGIG